MKITGLCPRVRVDTSATAAIGQAGGVLLTRTVTGTGLDRHLSAALAGWRKRLAIHDPGKIITDLALSLALGGDCLAIWPCCGPSRASMVGSGRLGPDRVASDRGPGIGCAGSVEGDR